MTFSVIIPIQITDALLTSTTVPENDYPVWTAGATFASGAFCISTVTHRVYQSQQANNTAKDPTLLENRSGATVYWTDYGPTNARAMFDGEVSTQTIGASPMTVVLHPGGFNAVYLAGIEATGLSITVRDAPGGNIIFTAEDDLEASAPGDYDEYFFSNFKPRTDFVATEIDQYQNAEVTVTLTSTTGQVKCGVLVVGDLQALGDTQYGAKAKPKTYSYIKTNEWGKTEIVRRKAATDMTGSAWLKLNDATSVLDRIRSLLDVPAVWIGSDLPEYGGLRVFGLGSGEISYDHPQDCLLTLNIQGLI